MMILVMLAVMLIHVALGFPLFLGLMVTA